MLIYLILEVPPLHETNGATGNSFILSFREGTTRNLKEYTLRFFTLFKMAKLHKLQIWNYRFDKAMQTNPLVTLVLIILLNELISSLLPSKGEQGKFRFFPYPPLAPPNPIKTTAQTPQGRCSPVESVYRRPSRRREHALCLAKHD